MRGADAVGHAVKPDVVAGTELFAAHGARLAVDEHLAVLDEVFAMPPDGTAFASFKKLSSLINSVVMATGTSSADTRRTRTFIRLFLLAFGSAAGKGRRRPR